MFVNVSLVVVLHNTSPARFSNTVAVPWEVSPGAWAWTYLDTQAMRGGDPDGGSQKHLQMSKP